MARSTATTVLAAYGGTYPVGWISTTISTKCTEADSHIDNYTNPRLIATSGATVREIAHDVVFRLVRRAEMLVRSSGASSGEGYVYPDLVILTDEIKQRIDAMLRHPSGSSGVFVIDQMGSD